MKIMEIVNLIVAVSALVVLLIAAFVVYPELVKVSEGIAQHTIPSCGRS